MKILIDIQSNSALLWQESLYMAFALASFEHDIYINIGQAMLCDLIKNPEQSSANMLASLDLYGIKTVWQDEKSYQKFDNWQKQQMEDFAWVKELQSTNIGENTTDLNFKTIFVL